MGFMPVSNRFHYLKFSLPDAYNLIEESGIKTDASLGFAGHIGFRNSYGLPFRPYNFATGKPYCFIEIPLMVMDRTLGDYMKIEPEKIPETVISFFEKNKFNCLFSVLWHNIFCAEKLFSKQVKAYKKILEYFYENKVSCVSASEWGQQILTP